MSRIFLVGIGPLMDGGARRVTAHAVRAWRFVSALRHAGHDVNLCTFSQNISPHDPMERMVEPRAKDGFAYENLDMRMGNVLGYLSEQCRRLSPDCVIGVGTEPSGWACRMRPTAPVWADLHGWVMAEAQIKAAHDGSDEILSHFWRHERPVLLRADKISVVSTPQRFALLGELGTAGRLNRHNVGYD
ncbi:glycosyltransferase, partial [Candidatus Sumerlaeota bacterium]|nr:glycosyltransferase [Candidatus Sumerlaeota bacterium]